MPVERVLTPEEALCLFIGVLVIIGLLSVGVPLFFMWKFPAKDTAIGGFPKINLDETLGTTYDEETGFLVGYKWLLFSIGHKNGRPWKRYYSPTTLDEWSWSPEYGVYLKTSAQPSYTSAAGIYAVKRVDDPELDQYGHWTNGIPGIATERHGNFDGLVKVKLLLSGEVLETDTLYRAEEASVCEILEERMFEYARKQRCKTCP